MADDNLNSDQTSVANDSPKQELTSLQKNRKKMLDNTAKLVPGRLNVQKGTNFRKLLKTVNFILFGAKRTVNRIDQWRAIDKAKGKALDVIGQDWGVYRNGSDDDFYRFLIRFKQSQSRADGSINSLIRVISEALGADPKDIHISDVPGEPQAIKITGIPNAYLDTDQKLRFVLKNLQSSVAAGIRVTGISFADSASVIIRFGSAVITRSSYEIKDPSVSDKDFYVGGAGLQNESMTGGTPENMDKGVSYVGGAGLISTSGEVTAPLIISDNLWDPVQAISTNYYLGSEQILGGYNSNNLQMPNLIPVNGASYISIKEKGNTNIGIDTGRIAFFDADLKYISCPIQPDSKNADYSTVAAIPVNAEFVLLHTPWGNTGETDIRLIGQTTDKITYNLIPNSRVNETSSVYGFAQIFAKTYVEAGKTYTFMANGHASEYAVSNKRGLLVALYDGSWTKLNVALNTASTTDTTVTKTFVSNYTGYVSVTSYSFPSGNTDAQNLVTINWYKLVEGTGTSDDYVDGHNLISDPNLLNFNHGANAHATVTVEPYDSTTNMFHVVASKGSGGMAGIYFFDPLLEVGEKWEFSADMKGHGIINEFYLESSKNVESSATSITEEWTRYKSTGICGINPTGVRNGWVIYFDANTSDIDVYIKFPQIKAAPSMDSWIPAQSDLSVKNLNG